jgi:hypothetical protein
LFPIRSVGFLLGSVPCTAPVLVKENDTEILTQIAVQVISALLISLIIGAARRVFRLS